MTPTLSAALEDTPVVCLLGPRQVGKTTLAQKSMPQRAYISFDDLSLLTAAKQDPVGFVNALPVQVTLDEVQRIPELMPAIKAAVDKKRLPGRFLLTGSANLLLQPQVSESLAGRVEVIYLHPLSESEKQSGEDCLLDDFIKGKIRAEIASTQEPVFHLPKAVVSGGYPEPNTRPLTRARQWYRQYINAIIQHDVKNIAAIRDENELLRLIELLACRTGSLLNYSNMANDLGISRETVEKYLLILERLFLFRRLPAWHRNQAKRLVKSPKIHVVDSGLAAAMNRLDIKDWYIHGTEFGAILESFVVQQLICQSGWLDYDLHFSHYRDKDQVEVDLVIEQGRDVWGVEIKRSATLQARDGAGLKRLAAQAGKHFKGGFLLYSGANCFSIGDQLFAVPMD
ncbi:MAG: AAA family ATPase, partial [Gammaproteobacteria bacterium]